MHLSGSDPPDPRNDACLVIMLALVTYQTHTRQNPQMVMSLPLGISQYLGGPQYDFSCKIFESFQDSPHFTMPHVRHG